MSQAPPQDLLEAKLRGLLRANAEIVGDVDLDQLQLIDTVGGAAGVVGARGFFLIAGDDAVRSLGPALLWADRNGAVDLDLLVEPDIAGHLGRRAALFDPPVRVWTIVGTSLEPARPIPAMRLEELSASELELRSTIERAGARAIDDNGRLVAEVAGLEVARVVPAEPGSPAVLEVGVGQADRLLNQTIHGPAAPDVALRRVVELVSSHRRPGAPHHPLNQLARDRWLRSVIVDDPALVGLTLAEPVPPLRPVESVGVDGPSAAVGADSSGEAVVVVCSAGVDTDLVPEAADYRARHGFESRLLIVLAEHNRHPAVLRQLDRVPRVSLHSLDEPWRATTGTIKGGR